MRINPQRESTGLTIGVKTFAIVLSKGFLGIQHGVGQTK